MMEWHGLRELALLLGLAVALGDWHWLWETGTGYECMGDWRGLWGTSISHGRPARAMRDRHGLCETGFAVGTLDIATGIGGLTLPIWAGMG
jgi:hypothetical protein